MVHYQIPASADVYVHRCGRTARAASDGLSVALVTSKESTRFRALMKVGLPGIWYPRFLDICIWQRNRITKFLVKDIGQTKLLLCGYEALELAPAFQDCSGLVCLCVQYALVKGPAAQALGREGVPPAFPVDAALLPGAHKRVALAARIDEVIFICPATSLNQRIPKVLMMHILE